GVGVRLNHGDGTFEPDSSLAWLPITSLCSFADVDGDGDLDIAFGSYGRLVARNRLERLRRPATNELRVRVESDDGRDMEPGATVRVRSLDDPRHPVQTRVVDGGSGYLGQDEYTLTFGGLGSGAYDVEVSFPSKPGAPRVVGPAENPLLAGIRPAAGPMQCLV